MNREDSTRELADEPNNPIDWHAVRRALGELPGTPATDRNTGTNEYRIAAQAREIHSWIQNTTFGGGRDRAISRLMENPDKFIDPTLSTSANYESSKTA